MSTLDDLDRSLARERADPNRGEDRNGCLRRVSPDKYLPGDPSKGLIRKVRSFLKGFGVAPGAKQERLWRQTWDWAWHVARSYRHPALPKSRPSWPSFCEIATQYLALVLLEAKESGLLRMPCRAFDPKCVPAHLAGRLKAGAAALPAGMTEAAGPAAIEDRPA